MRNKEKEVHGNLVTGRGARGKFISDRAPLGYVYSIMEWMFEDDLLVVIVSGSAGRDGHCYRGCGTNLRSVRIRPGVGVDCS
jgi:hypothetical protein